MAIASKTVLRRSFVGGRLVKRHFIDGQPADLLAVAEAVAPKAAEPGKGPVDLMNDEDPKLVDLDGLTKAELIAQAAEEGVEVETDDNKADIVRKIEAKRHG